MEDDGLNMVNVRNNGDDGSRKAKDGGQSGKTAYGGTMG